MRQPDGDIYTPRLWAEGRMGYCGIVDFTNPDAVAWWRGKHGPLLDIGVDAFKTDFGEEIPADAVLYNGKTGPEIRNVYAKLFQRIAFDAVRERYGRGLIWGRAGFAGMRRCPAHWSGDPKCTYEDLAATIRAGLAAGLSGIPMWSHDIGGFWGTPAPDLYIRWAQFGLLSTLSRCHGLTHRDPWEFGDEAVEIFRWFARLRYRLIPYFYSTALDAAETGLPVMRAMVLDHPDEPGMTLADGQYYLGDSL
ncbi:MAG: alpha-xylosidase, partial [Armatimonadetes bacterium]|nr:alpha-xylosidase [Armatimonadota bacterium]